LELKNQNNIFTIGGATIIHGDCRDYLQDIKDVDAIVTDPPYGIDFRSNRRTATEKFDHIEGDNEIDVSILAPITTTAKDRSCLVIFTRWDVEHEWLSGIEDAGWDVKSQLIWFKGGGGIGNLYQSFMAVHENMWFAIRGDWSFPNKRPSSVYQIPKMLSSTYEHPTAKPSTLLVSIIQDITYPGDTVFDPFMGSCPCGVACLRTGRKFIGIEKDEKYFELSKRNLMTELNSNRLLI
jgi:site-specific DNA-methyltransferase (adenine-specific)